MTEIEKKTLPSRNVEIKAKVREYGTIITKAKELSGKDGILLCQKDTFFFNPTENGRLKLREENGTAELISYSRPDAEGPKLSTYRKCHVQEPARLSVVLEDALGVKGVVKKQRLLFFIGQTRVHIDHVENLGNFMELEVMLTESQSPEEGQVIAKKVMGQLGVSEEDLLAGAYMDMLLSDKPSS